jgi:hypothetical protein
MISVIMCSRNDNYGVNLHQRTALSLNCWADQLSLEDEILFIDESAEGTPTLPEAVRHMLTSRALKLLKGYRVPATVHESWGVTTPVAEMHCRNIGIRKAEGDWIISTTNDNIPIFLYPHILDLENVGFYASWVQLVPVQMWTQSFFHRDLFAKLMMLDGFLYRHRGANEALIHPKAGDMLIGPHFSFLCVSGFEEGMIHHGGGEAAVLKKAKHRGMSLNSCVSQISVFHLEHAIINDYPNHFQDGSLTNSREEWFDDLTETRNSDDWGMYPVEEIKLT